MKFSSARRILSRFLLAVAYLSCMLQWLWVATVAVPPLVRSGILDGLVRTPQPQSAVHSQPTEMNPLLWVVAIAVTITMVALTIIVLLRLPRAIAKTSDHVVRQAATSIVPVITHHHVLPAKKQREISRRTRLAVQICAAILPLAISFFLPPYEEITRQILLMLSGYLAGISLVLFIAAWLLEVPKRTTSRTRSHVSRG